MDVCGKVCFCTVLRSVRTIQFLEQVIIQIERRVNDANQHFYELKQCQKNNWIQKIGSCELTHSGLEFQSLRPKSAFLLTVIDIQLNFVKLSSILGCEVVNSLFLECENLCINHKLKIKYQLRNLLLKMSPDQFLIQWDLSYVRGASFL